MPHDSRGGAWLSCATAAITKPPWRAARLSRALMRCGPGTIIHAALPHFRFSRPMLKRFWLTFAGVATACAVAAPIVTGTFDLNATAVVLPRFMALVLPICAFPAGVVAARWFALGARPSSRLLGALIGSGVAIALLTLFLYAVAGPVGGRLDARRQDDLNLSPSTMLAPVGVPSAALETGMHARGPAAPDPGDADAIRRRRNQRRWEYQHRVAHAVLAPIIACLAVCISLWVRAWTPRRDVQTFLLWCAGAMTLSVVYASVEASFEAAMGVSGPVAWGATLHQIVGVPLTALVALGWPTVVMWWAPRPDLFQRGARTPSPHPFTSQGDVP